MPLIVLITVLFVGAAFFAGATGAFLITVDPLVLLESLAALPLPPLSGGARATVLFPLPIAPIALVLVAFRAAVALRPDFAFSTMPVRIPAAPPAGAGGEGFRGETGRARRDFSCDVLGRTGDL
jgi:hypothetical protein